MATNYTPKPIDLWSILRKVGLSSFIVYGVALLIISIGVIGMMATTMSQAGGLLGLAGTALAGMGIAAGIVNAILSILLIIMGPAFTRQKLGRLPFMGLLLYSIGYILSGIVYIVASTMPFSSAFLAPGALSMVGAVLLICAGAVFLSQSTPAKAVGAILGIVSVCLLMASRATAPAFAAALAGLGSLTGSGYIELSGMLIAGVGAMLFALLRGKKGVEISHIIIAIAVLIFGIGTAVSSISSATGFVWDFRFVPAIWSLWYVGDYIMIAAGFLIITSASLGLTIIAKSLISAISTTPAPVAQAPVAPPPAPQQPVYTPPPPPPPPQQVYAPPPPPPPQQPQPRRVSFCPNCGTPLKPGDKFCGSCGARID